MQLEILRRETESNNLIKEDLEMELQALRHQMLNTHSTNRDVGMTNLRDSSIRFNTTCDALLLMNFCILNQIKFINNLYVCSDNVSKKHKVLEAQKEALSLRQIVTEKDSEVTYLVF